VTADVVKDTGGVMKYWHLASTHRPRVSKMASDFCSAPGECFTFDISQLTLFKASSVDAERAFSNGRLEVNHLQHNTSPQTFKAQMAVGSWCRTPLYPGLLEVTKIIEQGTGGDDIELDVEFA
jgi:hypothetical protein